jgi:histidine triad (HIT) family protein
MNDCVFCQIVKGEKSADIVLDTEDFVVFPDINPHAPVHLLIVPKKHIKDITEVDNETWSKLKDIAVRLGKERELDGYRLVHNVGDAALVPHLHVHFMGGISAEDKV